MIKQCKKCNIPKQLTEFRYNTKGKYSWYENICKKCNITKVSERRKLFPRIHKNSNLLRKFNITIDDFDNMLKQQNKKCYLCNVTHDSEKFGLRVDHSHKTGKVRKLLCDNCNKGLGHFKDSQTILQSAIDYLDKHSTLV